mgnify:CR=1 FL=1|jgi:hypothetical protein
MTVCKIGLMLLTVILMIIIGVLMQWSNIFIIFFIDLKSFLYVLTVSTSINLCINVFRNLYYGPPGKSKETLVIS